MAIEVIFSEEAKTELDNIRIRLTQRGAGKTAQNRLNNIFNAIERISTRPDRYPQDHFKPENKQLAVNGYVVSFNYRLSDSGTEIVVVERVYSPGQNRALESINLHHFELV